MKYRLLHVAALIVLVGAAQQRLGASQFLHESAAYFGGKIAFGYTEAEKGDEALLGGRKYVVGYYGDRWYGAVFEENERDEAAVFYDWLLWADKTTGREGSDKIKSVHNSFYAAFMSYLDKKRYMGRLENFCFMDSIDAARLMQKNKIALIKTREFGGYRWQVFDIALYKNDSYGSAKSAFDADVDNCVYMLPEKE